MNSQEMKKISRFMSLVLRHQPATAGLRPDRAGWVHVEDLLAGMARARRRVTLAELQEVVRDNDKQRFQFSEDGLRIRATQGHSIQIDHGYDEAEPPELLCHGTPEKFVESIRREGLTKQKRHHVHLHADRGLAADVGRRRGKPVVLIIEAARMASDGHKFYVTPNDVWLTDRVPPEYLRFPS